MPRFSRISWKSRDDAEPPRIASRSEAAKRRRSERAIPGAPRQTWYCSVSFRWKRRPGAGASTSGRRTRGPCAGGRRPSLRSLEQRDEPFVLECCRRPRRRRCRGYIEPVVGRERAPRDRRDHVRASRSPAGRAGARRRPPRRRGRARAPAACPRTSRSPRARPRAPSRARRRRREDHVGHHVERRLEPCRRGRARRRPCARARWPRSARRRGRRRSRRSPAPCRRASP